MFFFPCRVFHFTASQPMSHSVALCVECLPAGRQGLGVIFYPLLSTASAKARIHKAI